MRKIGLVLCLILFVALPASFARSAGQNQPIVITPVGVYPVTVNYDLTVAELVRLGNYDYANPHVTDKNFPVEGKGTVSETILLVGVNRWVTNDEILSAMEKENLRPINAKELLTLGIQYPNRQRAEDIILGLGSVWWRFGYEKGNNRAFWDSHYVPFLFGSKTRRSLHAVWTENYWHGGNLFAVVRK